MKKIEQLKAKRDKLDRKIKELEKPKFEVGKWYKINNLYLYCITQIRNEEAFDCYGFFKGDWIEVKRCSNVGFVQATHEEVEQALIEEAKRRYGNNVIKSFVENDKYKGVILEKGNHWYKEDTNELWIESKNYNLLVFRDGEWAEIIEDKVIINGYEMQVDGDIVSFGCASFHKSDLKRWYQAATKDRTITNRHIVSYKLDSGVELSIEDLEKIVKKLS